mgnify:CR=1 FL=1
MKVLDLQSVTEIAQIYVPLGELVDIEKEKVEHQQETKGIMEDLFAAQEKQKIIEINELYDAFPLDVSAPSAIISHQK